MKDQAVAEFIEGLEPTLRKQVEQIRKAILSASPKIEEGIKWNVPSFRAPLSLSPRERVGVRADISEWFATFHLRGEGVRLILHLGAKAKKSKQIEVEDPSSLVEWLGKERAMITFTDAKDVKAKSAALKRLIKEWITLL